MKKLKQIFSCIEICAMFVFLFSAAQIFGLFAGFGGCIAKNVLYGTNINGTGVIEKFQIIMNKNQPEMIFFMEITAAVFMFLTACLIYKKKLKSLFMFKRPLYIIMSVGTVIAIYIIMSALLNAIPWPQSWIEANRDSTAIALSNNGNIFITWISTGVLAPFTEELVFRGMIVSILRKKHNKHIAIIASSAAFGIVHGNILQGLYTCILGLIFCFINDKEHSIMPGLAAHMSVNSISVLLSNI